MDGTKLIAIQDDNHIGTYGKQLGWISLDSFSDKQTLARLAELFHGGLAEPLK